MCATLQIIEPIQSRCLLHVLGCMLHAVCCLLQIIEPIQSRCAILRFTKLTDMNVLERLNVPLPISLHRIPANFLDPSRRLFRGPAISLSRYASHFASHARHSECISVPSTTGLLGSSLEYAQGHPMVRLVD
jgi:hypothetical protein